MREEGREREGGTGERERGREEFRERQEGERGTEWTEKGKERKGEREKRGNGKSNHSQCTMKLKLGKENAKQKTSCQQCATVCVPRPRHSSLQIFIVALRW